jgi:hypothetical protein
MMLLALGGCSFSRNYVLSEPLKINVDGSDTPVVLPAGARVRETFHKAPITFVEIQATTTQPIRGDVVP